MWQNQGGRDTIRQFLRVIHRGIDGLNEYQRKCRDQKIQEAEAKEQKPWDEHMALIPPLPPGFERWAFHEATVENFIFYESIKDKTGYCTYCENRCRSYRQREIKKENARAVEKLSNSSFRAKYRP